MGPSYQTINTFLRHIFYVTELDSLEVTMKINKASLEGQGTRINHMERCHLPSFPHLTHPTSFTDDMRLKQTSKMALALEGKASLKRMKMEERSTALPTGPW